MERLDNKEVGLLPHSLLVHFSSTILSKLGKKNPKIILHAIRLVGSLRALLKKFYEQLELNIEILSLPRHHVMLRSSDD